MRGAILRAEVLAALVAMGLTGCATSRDIADPIILGSDRTSRIFNSPSPGKEINNVVILLDASGSMRSIITRNPKLTRMDAAKTALKQVVTRVSPDTRIGLLVFGADNIRDYTSGGSSIGWACRLGPRNDARLSRAIDLPIPKYKTPLGTCIDEAAGALVRQRKKDKAAGATRLIIITDGQADDPDVMDKAISVAASQGVTIDVIGVAMSETHRLAAQANSYVNAESLSGIATAVAKVFAEISGDDVDASGESVFDVLKPLSEDVAGAILKALDKASQK